jgi:hypothetical protein
MIELSITDDGDPGATVVLSLTTHPAELLSYTPIAPSQDARTVIDESDGGEQPNIYWRNVTESATIQYYTADEARGAFETLNRFFEKAKRRQRTGVGARVFVRFRPDLSEALYRSEILSGRVQNSNLNQRMQVTVTWTRRYYWEAASEIQLGLYNNVTGGSSVNLFNHSRDVDNRNNFVKANTVQGELPAPARIELLNNYNSVTRTQNFYLAHMLEGGTPFPHMIEAESGTNSGGTSTVTNAAWSNGSGIDLVATGTAEITAWYYLMPSTTLEAAGGNWFRVLVYIPFSPTASDIKIKARISIDLITTLWEGQWVSVGNNATLLDLGTVQLPAYLVDAADVYPLTIELRTKRSGSGSVSVPIDFVELAPLQSWRLLRSLGYDTGYNVTLHDDPAKGLIYTNGWSPAGSVGNYVALGSPIMLVPGYTNVIYLLVTPTDTILRSTQIKVFYRPRRLTI